MPLRAPRGALAQACVSTHRPTSTISPVSSSIGTKSSGWMTPRVGCFQRISASIPVGLGCAGQTSADRRGRTRFRERVSQAHAQLHLALHELLHPRLEHHAAPAPARLARYIAMPASRRSSSACSRSPAAIPTLAVRVRRLPGAERSSNGWRSAPSSRSAIGSAPSAREAGLRDDGELVAAEAPEGVAVPEQC